jgi:hypothetical protein
VFWVFAAAGLVFSLAATFGYAERSAWVGEHLPWLVSLAAFRWWPLLTGETTLPGEPISWPDVVIGAGQATLLGLAGGAVLLARGAIRAEGPRRALNVVWDVIAFWPRAVHPFVPPPYAQSVVPALVRRICWHLGEPDPLRGDGEPAVPADQPADRTDQQRAEVNPDFVRTVVVAAHSQGSLISLAALLWLPEPIRHRVRWLTFGSQLRQAFPLAFPHYVTVPILRHVLATHGWLNLYRDTDPIAGPVTSWGHTWGPGALTSCRLEQPGQPLPDEIRPRTGRRECGREWRLLDPVPEDRALQRRPAAELQKHSNYWLDPDWDDALRAVGAPLGSVADEQRDRQPVQ